MYQHLQHQISFIKFTMKYIFIVHLLELEVLIYFYQNFKVREV